MRYKINKQTKVSDQQLVSQLSGSIFSASRGRKGFIIAFFYTILAFLTGVASYISRCFLRKKLGERTFGVFTILAVYVLIVSVNFLHTAFPVFMEDVRAAGIITWDDLMAIGLASTQESNNEVALVLILMEYIHLVGVGLLSSEIKYLWYVILVLSAFHFAELYISKRQGDRYHSFYRGDSLLFGFLENKKFFGFTISSLFTWMVLEPLLVWLIAFFVKNIFQMEVLGLLLQISALCLFIEEYRVYSENRQLVLDLIDSEIDSHYIVAVKENIQQRDNDNDLQSGRVIIE